MSDDDRYGWDDEHVGPTEIDRQTARYVAEDARAEALREGGVCQHSAAVGVPADGKARYPQQEGLKPGEMACMERTADCRRVFPTSEAWDRARHSAFA